MAREVLKHACDICGILYDTIDEADKCKENDERVKLEALKKEEKENLLKEEIKKIEANLERIKKEISEKEIEYSEQLEKLKEKQKELNRKSKKVYHVKSFEDFFDDLCRRFF